MSYYHYFGRDSSQLIKLLQQIVSDGIKIKDNFWENVVIQGSGAFFGALFAFLFGLLTFFLQKKRERFIMHKNAVVELEYLINEHFNVMAKDNYLIEHDIAVLRDEHFTYDRLYELRLIVGLELKIGDLDVINRYFTYKESVATVNGDLNRTNLALDNINNAAIARGPDFIHKKNFVLIANNMEILNKFLKSLTDEAKDLLAFIRVYSRRINSYKEKGLNIYKLDGYRDISEEEIKEELRILNKEVDETMKESEKNIRKTLG